MAIRDRNFRKNLLLVAVLALITVSIFYLQSQKTKVNSGAIDRTLEQQDNDPNNQSAQAKAENTGKGTVKNLAYPKAPEFAGIEKWINSEPLKMEQLRGKVVLIDFWTYSCINCIRTLPYLKAWDKKYKDKGLVIIGVHSPEFEFEKKYENVLSAVNKYQIEYPVAQDNEFVVWQLYKNLYWPHKFLIDQDGYIRYNHIGEGNYDETEKQIQQLLKERMERLNEKSELSEELSRPKEAVESSFRSIGTPEIYMGYQFTRGNFGNEEGYKADKIVHYEMPNKINENDVYLNGDWKNNADNVELASDYGEVVLKFKAKSLNIVAGSDSKTKATIFLDDKTVDSTNKGTDVIIQGNTGFAEFQEYKLYNLVDSGNYNSRTIKMKVSGKGFKLFTFTFG